MNKFTLYFKAVLNILIAIVVILCLIFIFPKLIGFFMPFVIGWIIAMITNPLVKFMEKRVKIVRKHSSAIIIIGALAAVIVLIYFGITILIRELSGFIADIPNIYADFEVALHSASQNLNGVYDMVPSGLQGFLEHLNGNVNSYIDKFISNLSTPSISDAGLLARNVADIFFKTIITILSAYFFIAERENMAVSIKKVTPKSVQDKYILVVNNFKLAVGGYFKAQFKIMAIVSVIIFIGLEVMQVDYSFLVAIGIAFIDLLPVFGTGTIFLPWVLIDLLSGNYIRAAAIAAIYIICQIVRQILQPKMVGDSIGLSPVLTLVFMYIGYKMKGVIGLILGIPIGMVIMNFYKSGVFDSLIQSVKLLAKDINDFRRL